jgi:hypothetical protein
MEDGTKSSSIRHFWMRQPRAERADKIADAAVADAHELLRSGIRTSRHDREEHQTDERH